MCPKFAQPRPKSTLFDKNTAPAARLPSASATCGDGVRLRQRLAAAGRRGPPPLRLGRRPGAFLSDVRLRSDPIGRPSTAAETPTSRFPVIKLCKVLASFRPRPTEEGRRVQDPPRSRAAGGGGKTRWVRAAVESWLDRIRVAPEVVGLQLTAAGVRRIAGDQAWPHAPEEK